MAVQTFAQNITRTNTAGDTTAAPWHPPGASVDVQVDTQPISDPNASVLIEVMYQNAQGQWVTFSSHTCHGGQYTDRQGGVHDISCSSTMHAQSPFPASGFAVRWTIAGTVTFSVVANF
jgi:hypothetical protein